MGYIILMCVVIFYFIMFGAWERSGFWAPGLIIPLFALPIIGPIAALFIHSYIHRNDPPPPPEHGYNQVYESAEVLNPDDPIIINGMYCGTAEEWQKKNDEDEDV